MTSNLGSRARELLHPITADSPSGKSATADSRAESLRDLVLSLEAPTGGVAPWRTIADLGASLLATTTKDLTIGCYTAGAWAHELGLEGIREGCDLLRGLLDTYWETCFPPLSRKRARSNAVSWFVERCPLALSGATSASSQEVEQTIASWQALKASARARLDDQCPAFDEVETLLERLRLTAAESAPSAHSDADAPVHSEAASASSASTSPASTPSASTPSASTPSASTPPASTPPEHGPAPSAEPPSARAPEAPTATPTEPSPPAPPSEAAAPAPAKVPGAVDDAVQAAVDSQSVSWDGNVELAREFLQRSGASLIQLADALFSADDSDETSYRIRRIGLWMPLGSPPPASDDGTTRVPALPPARREKLELLATNDRHEVLLLEAEGMSVRFPLHLDLQRWVYESLIARGPRHAAAAQAVLRAARDLVERLPSLPTLRAADGHPLADDRTRAWLSPPPPTTVAQSSPRDEDTDWDEVRDLIRRRELHEAFDRAGCGAADERTRFERRLRVAELLVELGLAQMAAPLFRALGRTVDERQLDRWEPRLAVRCWQGLLSTESERSDAILDRLFLADPPTALLVTRAPLKET